MARVIALMSHYFRMRGRIEQLREQIRDWFDGFGPGPTGMVSALA